MQRVVITMGKVLNVLNDLAGKPSATGALSAYKSWMALAVPWAETRFFFWPIKSGQKELETTCSRFGWILLGQCY